MTHPFGDRVLRALRDRRFARYCLLAAVVVALPTLAIGFYCDDWIFVARLEGHLPGPHGTFDLYRFTNVSREEMHTLGLPWWFTPDFRLDFFRPLGSALLALDHRLFGHAPLGYHLHALLWYVALALGAGIVLRRALPDGTGALALLIFVIDPAHVQPVGWLSCRHALVAAALSMVGIAAHVRAREESWPRGRVISVVAIGIGLLAGETALGAVVYVAAYELVGRRGEALKARVFAMLPIAALSFAYLANYRANGHGAAHNDQYFEPFSDPAGFINAIAHRLPILLGDLFVGVPADFANAFDPRPMMAIGVVITLGVGVLAWMLRSRMTEREKVSLGWLMLGSLGSLVAASGGYPGSRLLLLPSLGGAALLAVLIRRGFLEVLPIASQTHSKVEDSVWSTRAAHFVRAGSSLLAVTSLVLAPLAFTLSALGTAAFACRTEEAARSAEIHPPYPRKVFVLAGSDPMANVYAAGVLAASEPEKLSNWTMLSLAKHPHRVIRTSPTSLTLETTEGTLFDGAFVGLFRSTRVPFSVGDTLPVRDATIRVVAMKDGLPTRIEVLLDEPLDSPENTWLAWSDGRLREVELPPIGVPRDLPWFPGPTGLF